ncbi:hypothetical protein ISS06_00445 [Patescibacteria group bacterium]|nr:hypothetical protein [Patescibacteria group bacterium]
METPGIHSLEMALKIKGLIELINEKKRFMKKIITYFSRHPDNNLALKCILLITEDGIFEDLNKKELLLISEALKNVPEKVLAMKDNHYNITTNKHVQVCIWKEIKNLHKIPDQDIKRIDKVILC